MTKISNKLLILFCIIFLISSNLYAQSFPDDSLDTRKHSVESHYKLHLNPLLYSNKIFLGQDEFEIYDKLIISSEFQLNLSSDSKSLTELKFTMAEYLKNRQALLPNYDLGDFGKYLGYAQTLAVVLLAIAHISKYGFK